MTTTTKAAHTPGLMVKSPAPARFPAYRIVSDAGEVLATVPITASGDAHKLATVMAAAPDMKSALDKILGEISVRGSIGRDDWRIKEAADAMAKATGGA